MNADEAYKLVRYAAGKNLQQGYVSPEDFNTVIMPFGQRSYLDFILGEYQRYQIQRPISVVEFGQNERIRNTISPLIYNTILPINISGISPRPADYEYVDNMWGVYGFYNIRFVQEDRLDSYIHSDIDPVSENPVFLINHEGFKYFPDRPYGQNQAKMSYVRTPPSIIWGYTLDSNGVEVYNPATSQDPVWNDTDMIQIIARGLTAVGVNLQLGVLIQYAQELKEKGA